MSHSTGKPTKDEKARLDMLSKLPCLCCVARGKRQPSRTHIHHLVDNGTRKLSGGHMATIPICAWHHVGATSRGRTADEMVAEYGWSLALHKKKFVEMFGRERVLLASVNRLLEALR